MSPFRPPFLQTILPQSRDHKPSYRWSIPQTNPSSPLSISSIDCCSRLASNPCRHSNPVDSRSSDLVDGRSRLSQLGVNFRFTGNQETTRKDTKERPVCDASILQGYTLVSYPNLQSFRRGQVILLAFQAVYIGHVASYTLTKSVINRAIKSLQMTRRITTALGTLFYYDDR